MIPPDKKIQPRLKMVKIGGLWWFHVYIGDILVFAACIFVQVTSKVVNGVTLLLLPIYNLEWTVLKCSFASDVKVAINVLKGSRVPQIIFNCIA